jgi:iron complex transport system permease protein
MTKLSTAAIAALNGHRRLIRTRSIVLAALSLIAVAAFLIDVSTGPSSLTAWDVLQGILRPETLSAGARVIIWDVRLSQGVLAFMVGVSIWDFVSPANRRCELSPQRG